VLALLGKEVNVNATANDGTTALSAANQRGDGELAKLLVAKGAK